MHKKIPNIFIISDFKEEILNLDKNMASFIEIIKKNTKNTKF